MKTKHRNCEKMSLFEEAFFNLLTTSIFVRLVLTIGFSITEKFFVETFSVTTQQFAVRALGFISLKYGKYLPRF